MAETIHGAGFHVFQDDTKRVSTGKGFTRTSKTLKGGRRKPRGLGYSNSNKTNQKQLSTQPTDGPIKPLRKSVGGNPTRSTGKTGRRPRRALGDITNNQSGRTKLGKSVTGRPSEGKIIKKKLTKLATKLDIDALLDNIDIEDIELVHGSSKPVPYDSGVDAGAICDGIQKLAARSSQIDDNVEELPLEKWGDDELDELTAGTTFTVQKDAKVLLEDFEDFTKFSLFNDE